MATTNKSYGKRREYRKHGYSDENPLTFSASFAVASNKIKKIVAARQRMANEPKNELLCNNLCLYISKLEREIESVLRTAHASGSLAFLRYAIGCILSTDEHSIIVTNMIFVLYIDELHSLLATRASKYDTLIIRLVQKLKKIHGITEKIDLIEDTGRDPSDVSGRYTHMSRDEMITNLSCYRSKLNGELTLSLTSVCELPKDEKEFMYYLTLVIAKRIQANEDYEDTRDLLRNVITHLHPDVWR